MRRRRNSTCPLEENENTTSLALPALHTQSAIRRYLGDYRVTAPPRQRLVAARIAFDVIARDPAAQAALAAHSYDAERLRQGRTLLTEAQVRVNHQKIRDGAMSAARYVDILMQDGACTMYQRCLRLARIALRDMPELQPSFSLMPPRRRDPRIWQVHARQLYVAMSSNPALAERLADYGLSLRLLNTIQDQLGCAPTGHAVRHFKQKHLLAASQARYRALAALDYWMREFLATAQIALASHQAFSSAPTAIVSA